MRVMKTPVGTNQRRFNLNLIIANKCWSISGGSSYNTAFISGSDTIMQQTSAALLGIHN